MLISALGCFGPHAEREILRAKRGVGAAERH
jgi:hypothetical protein